MVEKVHRSCRANIVHVIQAVSYCQNTVIARSPSLSCRATKQSFPSCHAFTIGKIASSAQVKKLSLLAMTVFLILALTGCATMRYPTCFKVEGKEFREFKDLDDDKALKVLALIYNVQPVTYDDGVARRIAIEEYQNLLSKRRSRYVNDSGIFQIKYDKVSLKSWTTEDLAKFYQSMYPKAACYYQDAAPELSEKQNAERIVYVTAVNAAAKELKRRDSADQAMTFAGQALAGALSIALAMI
jgi:hypothetical protein